METKDTTKQMIEKFNKSKLLLKPIIFTNSDSLSKRLQLLEEKVKKLENAKNN